MLSLSSQLPTNTNPSDKTSFTFEVDKVPPKQGHLSFQKFEHTFRGLVGRKLVLTTSSHENNDGAKFICVDYKMTGAVKAIHSAYMSHYNLKLSVSDFILMIGHGLAQHMEIHAEELRSEFVDFEGKQKIAVTVLELDWPLIVEQFSEKIKERVKTDLYDVIIDDTSVATKLSKMASEITIMDSFKQYFEYEITCICGIPKVTLVGSKEDWERLRSKVKKLQELNTGDRLKLNWWLEHLVPLVDKIVDQAVSRKIETDFWRNIYKYQAGVAYSSSPQLNGWITKFIPYLVDSNRDGKYIKNLFKKKIHPSELPNGVSKVPFKLNTPISSEDMILYGGFIGAQLLDDDTIEPAYFYAVGPDPGNNWKD